MITLLVIADDFTGALDTGVQFSKKGVPTFVTTDVNINFDALAPGIEVLVVDIESRHGSVEKSCAVVAQIVKAAVRAGVKHFYKKTDSTLRGNIGAELAALLDTCGRQSLAFIPAFPKSGRTTKNGIQYVDGVALSETVFANDPFEPVKHSAVADIIRQQTALPLEVIQTDCYGAAEKESTVKTIRILDAETDEDLWRLGQALKRADKLRALAGCAGFAEILPELLGLHTKKVLWESNTGFVLIVTGSVNQITLDQTRRAGRLGYRLVTLTPEQKLDAQYPDSAQCRDFTQEIASLLAGCGRVVLTSVKDREQVCLSERYARERAMPIESIRDRVAENIGRITAQILERENAGNLVVFGGDTLFAVLKHLRCSGIFPILEIAPGVVAAKIMLPTGSLNMITKSGGLGNVEVVGMIDHFLMEKRCPGNDRSHA